LQTCKQKKNSEHFGTFVTSSVAQRRPCPGALSRAQAVLGRQERHEFSMSHCGWEHKAGIAKMPSSVVKKKLAPVVFFIRWEKLVRGRWYFLSGGIF